MAFHTKKAFAEMCGLSTGNLSVYANRGKVVYSGELVDDNIEPNISFLKTRKEKVAASVGKPEVVEHSFNPPGEPPPSSIPVVQKPVTRPQRPPKVEKPGQNSGLYAHQQEKIQLQNEKLQEEIDLLRKKKEKLEGESLPIEHVRAFAIIQKESDKVAWEAATEDMLGQIAARFQIPREVVAEIKAQQTAIINKAVERSCAETKRALRRLQVEVSVKKGQGEHD